MDDFTWRVSRSGYLWGKVDLRTTVNFGLITPDTGEGVRIYKPLLDHPELFLEFAELGPSDNDYLRFAARYGSLTWDLTVVQRENCRRHWGEFRRAAMKWHDPLQSTVAAPTNSPPSVPRLADQLARRTGPNDGSTFGTALDTSREYERWIDWTLHASEMKLDVSKWIAAGRNPSAEHLTGLRRKLEAILTERLAFAFHPDTGWPCQTPTDLLSALWLQFATAVSGKQQYRACSRCGKLFGVSALTTDSGRARRSRDDKKYCSARCQQDAAYVLKKEKRHQRGLTSSPDQRPELLRGSAR